MVWVDIPDFTANQVVRATHLQQIHGNLYHLKDPMFSEQRLPGTSSDVWSVTITDWNDIDLDYYHLDFESSGNDLLMVATIRASHSAALGGGYCTFMLDNVRAGNTFGLYVHNDNQNVITTNQMIYMWTGVAAGSHTLIVQAYNGTTGTFEIWKDSCLSIKVMEF